MLPYVKDYRTRNFKYKVLVNFISTIYYIQRRYLCSNCQTLFVKKYHLTETDILEKIRIHDNGLQKKFIIDIVESRWKEDFYDYFFYILHSEMSNVRYIIIDMYSNYRQICHIFFKNAWIGYTKLDSF